MINYLEDIEPLQDQGVSDAVIAQHLSLKTAAPIQVENAREILLESGAVVIDPVTGNRMGILIDHYASLPDGDAKVLIAWFISHCLGNGEIVSTHEYPRSVQFASVQQSLPQSLQPVGDQLIQAGGGRGDTVVAADVSASRESYNLEKQQQEEADEAERVAEEQRLQQQELADEHFEQLQSLWNKNVAPLRDNVIPASNPASWKAALQLMADNFVL